VFRELSPYAILLSGGQVTIPKLFASNAPPYEPGLVTRWDVVAFDEVAGSHFKRPEDKQLYKDYMELGVLLAGQRERDHPRGGGVRLQRQSGRRGRDNRAHIASVPSVP